MKKCLLEECENLTANPKFCSLSCGSKHQARVTPRKRVERIRTCAREGCDEQFNAKDAAKRFCSRSCSATVNNLIRKTRKGFKNCIRCEGEIRGAGKLYCSSTCSAKYRGEEKIRQWLAGEWDGSSGTGASSIVRNYLIEQAGHRCTSPTCAVPGGFAEINPTTGRVPLEVDHIDGDCYNNSPDNLIVLCPNCHSLTPTYRALNKVSGRTYRVKYRK